MKRTLIAAAAVLAAGTAFAQSSVTLYGRVNTSVEYQTNHHAGDDTSRTVLQNNASRWGLRGSEDLGSGLKALFVLESGFQSDTGAANAAGSLFGREAWVGLAGNFGRVRLGNLAPTAAYYTLADYVSLHNHDTGTSEDKLYLYAGGAPLTNAIAYNTPSFGGVVVEAQFGLKETTVGGKNTAVVAANYDRGPLHLGASFVNGPTALGSFFTGAATAPSATYLDSKEYGVRALYELGAFTVGAYYVRNDLEGAGLADVKRDAYRLAGMYTMGAAELHANVGFADDLKVGGTDTKSTSALQYTLGANYNLSKRTKVYAFYTRVNNSKGIAYFNTVLGDDFSSVAVGVRHNF